MRCPKCQYISFGSANRCRNCGFDFSLAEAAPAFEDLPIQTGDEPIGPLADLPLGRPAATAAAAASSSIPASVPASSRQPAGREAGPQPGDRASGDLPLLSISALDDQPLVSAPAAPRPPLAVRREPPTITRPRQGREEDAGTLESAYDDLLTRIRPKTPAFADEDEVLAHEAAGSSRAPAAARLLGGVLDLALMAAIDAGVVILTVRVAAVTLGELLQAAFAPLAAFLLLLNGGYLVMFTAAGGQTIGKMAAGVRVVPDAGGPKVPFATSMLRAAAYLVSLLPAGLGFVPILFSPDGRALHDRLSSTRVVKA